MVIQYKNNNLKILLHLSRFAFLIKSGIFDMDKMIEITNGIFIHEEEFVFKASRSAGPGGQNVNKVNTRITLFFDIANSDSFSIQQKKRILFKLSTRADKNGQIRVSSQKHRTQKANRRAAIEKLQKLLADAVKTRTARKKTKIPYAAKQKRLEEKKRRGRLKQLRSDKDYEF
jgi:ribosome-associated protein